MQHSGLHLGGLSSAEVQDQDLLKTSTNCTYGVQLGPRRVPSCRQAHTSNVDMTTVCRDLLHSMCRATPRLRFLSMAI